MAERIRSLVPDETSTIHRALGPFGGSLTKFRLNAETPLPTDVVLVDEASLVFPGGRIDTGEE